MTSGIGLPLLAAVALTGLAMAGPAQAQQAGVTFFVASAGKGNGADLRGRAGAAAPCPAPPRAARARVMAPTSAGLPAPTRIARRSRARPGQPIPTGAPT